VVQACISLLYAEVSLMRVSRTENWLDGHHERSPYAASRLVSRGITKAVEVFFACLVYHALRLLRHDSKGESENSISTHRRVELYPCMVGDGRCTACAAITVAIIASGVVMDKGESGGTESSRNESMARRETYRSASESHP
jgi:hypothetical protein